MSKQMLAEYRINKLHEQKRKELAIYESIRILPLIGAIEDAKRVKREAIDNAQKAFLQAFTNI